MPVCYCYDHGLQFRLITESWVTHCSAGARTSGQWGPGQILVGHHDVSYSFTHVSVDSDLVMRTHVCRTVPSCFSSQRPSSSRLSLPWFCLDSTMVMAHWSVSRPTLSADSSRYRTQRRDWYFVSLHWLRVPERIIFKIAVQTYRAIHGDVGMSPSSNYGSSHRSPTFRLDKDCGLLHPTIYSFLLSDCLLLDVAPSSSPALAYGTTCRCHLSTISAHLRKTTKIACFDSQILA